MQATLGAFELSLNVKDLAASLEFYEKLGFEPVVVRHDRGYAVVRQGHLKIGLYQGHVDSNLITFFGGDVLAIQQELESKGVPILEKAARESDGTVGMVVADPDGNKVYFNSSKED